MRLRPHPGLVHEQRKFCLRSTAFGGSSRIRLIARHTVVGVTPTFGAPTPLRRVDMPLHYDVPDHRSRFIARAEEYFNIQHKGGDI